MKQILVATDLSERSEKALQRAFQLAEQHGAGLTVLTVVDNDLPAKVAAAVKRETEAQLAPYCRSVSAYPHTVRVEIDDPLLSIHRIAEEINADLIVLGLHRSRPLADLFGGTTLVRLIRGSRRPVLVVRDPVDQPYQRPVCGLDFSPSCVAAASVAAALAPDARIATFHAVNIPFRGIRMADDDETDAAPFVEEAQQKLDAWLAEAGLPEQCDEPVVMATYRARALARMVREASADLIALGAHGRSGFAPTHLGSFVEDLLSGLPCDILIVRR